MNVNLGARASSDYLSCSFRAPLNEETPLKKITFNLIKKILEEKKDARNTLIQTKYDTFTALPIDLVLPLTIGAFVATFFFSIGAIFLKDPFKEKLSTCTLSCKLMDTEHQRFENVLIEKPCAYNGDYRGDATSYLPFIFSLCLLAPLMIKLIQLEMKIGVKKSKSLTKLEKITDSLSEINNYAHNILRVNQEDSTEDSTEEIPQEELELLPQDLKTLFPFIPNELLSQLTFAHLENAKKNFEELFEKKLNDHLFSSEQQAIWYLFRELKEANLEKCLQILSRKLNQMILGSDPLVFEYLVKMKKSEIQEANEELIFLLSHILKQEILEPTIDYYDTEYDEKSLAALIQSIATGNDWHILHKENNK